ncbi:MULTISPECIES: flagellar biosynthesis anti-sigma factor FlgM [unclassified Fusibacter]|uniref:flagellar biosynthesis anti-sigma factor FlgM n=1 Tax=unclassified Fusibacter TaxID=2624464 RepID=UPI001012F7B7|nr:MULTISPECIES: flagellar biosynthesis anti-sigma factor FlgM [unclassified Fusibacter]MCK8059841.1 flagellar biosynthesis anti-sigma factor FlgM [Fusibacter sp. A2]NPE21643.1 flagellar biosynthesis anti-sigma factor FlgM [Fusibacter sp. A1]RXV62047.1 flagellar biosynthesis anti-sigma factor FlgM [Fusibacter sp. A1]
MKIYGNVNVQNAMKTYVKPVNKTEKATGIKVTKDKIEISDAAREVQVATKAIKNLPDIREDLVQELKAAIKDGTYKPSSEDIAKKILGK